VDAPLASVSAPAPVVPPAVQHRGGDEEDSGGGDGGGEDDDAVASDEESSERRRRRRRQGWRSASAPAADEAEVEIDAVMLLPQSIKRRVCCLDPAGAPAPFLSSWPLPSGALPG
jgi:hypothetical protein